jgi:hypothetical protein
MRQGCPIEHPGPQPRPQQLEHAPVRDPLADQLHQDLTVEHVKEAADVGVDHPPSAARHLATDDLHRVVRRSLRAKPERAAAEVGLKDRLDDDLGRRLHHPILDGGNAQRPRLRAAGLGDMHPSHRHRAITPLTQLHLELVEERIDTRLLDLGDRDAINPGRAAIRPHLRPRPLQHIPAMDAIPERVEPSARRPLGRQVQLDLEFSDLVLLGVVGPGGHAPVLPSSSQHG